MKRPQNLALKQVINENNQNRQSKSDQGEVQQNKDHFKMKTDSRKRPDSKRESFITIFIIPKVLNSQCKK